MRFAPSPTTQAARVAPCPEFAPESASEPCCKSTPAARPSFDGQDERERKSVILAKAGFQRSEWHPALIRTELASEPCCKSTPAARPSFDGAQDERERKSVILAKAGTQRRDRHHVRVWRSGPGGDASGG